MASIAAEISPVHHRALAAPLLQGRRRGGASFPASSIASVGSLGTITHVLPTDSRIVEPIAPESVQKRNMSLPILPCDDERRIGGNFPVTNRLGLLLHDRGGVERLTSKRRLVVKCRGVAYRNFDHIRTVVIMFPRHRLLLCRAAASSSPEPCVLGLYPNEARLLRIGIISSPLDITLSPARFSSAHSSRHIAYWIHTSHLAFTNLHNVLRCCVPCSLPQRCNRRIVRLKSRRTVSQTLLGTCSSLLSCLVGPGRLVEPHSLPFAYPSGPADHASMKNLQFTPLILLIDPASSNLSTAALQLVLLTPDRLTKLRHGVRIVMFHHRQNGLIVDRLLLASLVRLDCFTAHCRAFRSRHCVTLYKPPLLRERAHGEHLR